MENNTSLSARIKRRNKQGFSGLGTGHMIDRQGNVLNFNTCIAIEYCGDYTDELQNHKYIDKVNDIKHKNKVGFRRSNFMKNRAMSKKYADVHQRLSK